MVSAAIVKVTRSSDRSTNHRVYFISNSGPSSTTCKTPYAAYPRHHMSATIANHVAEEYVWVKNRPRDTATIITSRIIEKTLVPTLTRNLLSFRVNGVPMMLITQNAINTQYPMPSHTDMECPFCSVDVRLAVHPTESKLIIIYNHKLRNSY